MTAQESECRAEFEVLLPLIQDGLNEYEQMLLQKHTRGDYNFLCTKIIADIHSAYHNTIGKELAEALEDIRRITPREIQKKEGFFCRSIPNPLYTRIETTLSKYRGTR